MTALHLETTACISRLSLISTLWMLLSVLSACSVAREPELPFTADWRNPVLPALVQPDRFPAPTPPTPVTVDDVIAESAFLADDIARKRFDLVAEGVPCGAVFNELADHASIALSVHLPLDAVVWLRVLQRPLDEVLASLAVQCGCRTELSANRLDVLPDRAFVRHYLVDYLNVNRDFDTEYTVDLHVGTPSREAVVSRASSASSLQTTVSSRPWDAVVDGITAIVEAAGEPQSRVVTVNREAGTVSVLARQTHHDAVQRYLDHVVSRLQRQVLIEASVIEIALDERHALGVDWQQLTQRGGWSWIQHMGSGIAVGEEVGGAVLQYNSIDGRQGVTAAVKVLQQFGDVRVVSTPRLIALNNQPSVLKVVNNTVYFSLDVDREVNGDTGLERQSVRSTIHTVPVGLMMHVTPQIASDGVVSLNVRPSVSRIVRYARDPNPTLAAVGVRNDVPEIQVREIDTTLRVRSGQTVALGGLRQLSDGSYRDAVPGLERLPWIGRLFASRDSARQQIELLILLTPHVLPVEGLA
ncbi:MAG: hypothetical protein AAF460_11125 [Pseudomonadota bacterium]